MSYQELQQKLARVRQALSDIDKEIEDTSNAHDWAALCAEREELEEEEDFLQGEIWRIAGC
jgi:uncharacterized protein involved in exopolysaccharide biosynthesis